MKGWLFTKTNVAPRLIEKEDPKAGFGEVVIDIKACGLCKTDIKLLEIPEYMALATAAPMIFGHECAGIVSELGEGVTNVKIGDRVNVVPQNPENPLDVIGFTRDGAYATKIAVPAHWLCVLPDNVSFTDGAIATDAGATAYHAMFSIGQAKKGMKVGIIGVGGLGMFATQMAVIEGCEVIAVVHNPNSKALAEELGCKKVYTNVSDLANDAPELIVDFAGTDQTVHDACAAVASHGTVVIVGCGAHGSTVSINSSDLTDRGIRVIGSDGNRKYDVEGVLEYFATGKLTPEINLIEFDEIGEGLERLRKGGNKGRIVALVK